MPTKNAVRIKSLEVNIVADYLSNVGRKEILKKYAIASRTLTSILNRNGVDLEKCNGRDKLKPFESEIVIRYEEGESTLSLANAFESTPSGIRYLLKRHKVKTRDQSFTSRRYELNENFFNKIDSEETAYFLGVLYADGCNMESEGTVTLSLHEKDKELLERLNKLIYLNRPLFLRKSTLIKNTKYISSVQYRLTIESNHLSKKLAQFGCMQRKTAIIKFPTWLDRKWVPHFVRGYFDGDGSVYYCKAASTGFVSIMGSIDFIDGIKEVLTIYCGIDSKIKKPEYKTVRTLAFHSTDNLRRFADFIYKDATIYMERKRERFTILLTSPNGQIKQNYFREIYGQEGAGKARGSRHAQSKLNELSVEMIKQLIAEGVTMDKVAAQFNVSRSCIEGVKYGRTWRHV